MAFLPGKQGVPAQAFLLRHRDVPARGFPRRHGTSSHGCPHQGTGAPLPERPARALGCPNPQPCWGTAVPLHGLPASVRGIPARPSLPGLRCSTGTALPRLSFQGTPASTHTGRRGCHSLGFCTGTAYPCWGTGLLARLQGSPAWAPCWDRGASRCLGSPSRHCCLQLPILWGDWDGASQTHPAGCCACPGSWHLQDGFGLGLVPSSSESLYLH